MGQWINLNRSVVVYQYPLLHKKIGPIFSAIVGIMAEGWQADKIRLDFENFKALHRLNYWDFYFTKYCNDGYQCISAGISKAKLILRCLLMCKKFGNYIFMSIPIT